MLSGADLSTNHKGNQGFVEDMCQGIFVSEGAGSRKRLDRAANESTQFRRGNPIILAARDNNLTTL